MTEIGPVLERLGLIQYFEKFIEEGFDTWETILDITESDLDVLRVRLGHRRKLQREIANSRGVSYEHTVSSPVRASPIEDAKFADYDSKATGSHQEGRPPIGGKRKYRRHPKPNENAPGRPPSAYVIFSNKIREILRPQNLSFTDIAKRVGESWQVLPAEEKESYEFEASAAKERFNVELAKYKNTTSYREYSQYLSEFKAKHASVNADSKRPRLLAERSSASTTSAGDQLDNAGYSPNAGRHRVDSFSSTSVNSGHPSPGRALSSSAQTIGNVMVPASPSTSSISTQSTSGLNQVLDGSQQDHIPNEGPVRKSVDALHIQHLPRILPLESRETIPTHNSLPPLVTEQAAQRGRVSPSDPRRTARVPPSFLHREATNSSVASSRSPYLSNGSTASSSHLTPATPVDDHRSLRNLPLPSSMALKTVSNSQLGEQPTYPIGAYRLMPPLHAQAGSPSKSDIPKTQHSIMNLSIAGDQDPPSRSLRSHSRQGRDTEHLQTAYPRPHSQSQQPPSSSSQSSSESGSKMYESPLWGTTTSHRRPQTGHNADQQRKVPGEHLGRSTIGPRTEQPSESYQDPPTDPLSVLAYAGRMVYRDSQTPP
ncbi:hypothetical protein MMC09_006768 [Bachmanniomyces sp. S44760]|nr:hypothetical protein [Bachmanniomyces sp. S44760]